MIKVGIQSGPENVSGSYTVCLRVRRDLSRVRNTVILREGWGRQTGEKGTRVERHMDGNDDFRSCVLLVMNFEQRR